MRASASVGSLFHCPRMTTIHTSGTTFGQSVGEVANAGTERPLTLCLGYRTKALALGKDCLLKLVSRFHRLKNQIVKVAVVCRHSRLSWGAHIASATCQVPLVGIA